MELVKVIVPTLNELDNIKEIKEEFSIERNIAIFNGYDIRFMIVDDTNNDDIKKEISDCKWIDYIKGEGNYGDSVIKGIIKSCIYKPDKIIMMDADHPYYLLYDMIQLLNIHDVVIGSDYYSNKERYVTKFLCEKLLGIKVSHPTCGFIGFNNYVIDDELGSRNIKWWCAKSKYDVIHLEFLKMCVNKNLNIGELSFDGSNVKHNYNFKRYIKWLFDFCNVLICNMLECYS